MPAVAANEPKSIDVASPISVAAMYVIHVFIQKRIQHLYPVVNLGRRDGSLFVTYLILLLI